MKSVAIAAACCAGVGMLSQAAWAQDTKAGVDDVSARAGREAIEWIEPTADLRYRYEFVDQGGFEHDAHASTLRARLGVRIEPTKSVTLFAEGEAVVHLGPDRFNDTTNGVVGRPVVADPEDLLLNQVYARWAPRSGAHITVGRQAVNYDNQRWVGSVGWRQNDQTLDAVTASVDGEARARFRASYGHAWRVNRVFGPDSAQGVWDHSDIHMVRIGADAGTVGTLTAYGYWLGIPDAPLLSSRTLGARIAGNRALSAGAAKLTYALEYARQSPHGSNPGDASHSYWLVEPGVALGATSIKLGYERLAGNGRTALQTPLATLHAFNGWADKFLTTPATGLRDLYLDLGYTVPGDVGLLAKTGIRVVYHDFRSTIGGLGYGREWNASIARPLFGPLRLTLKLASYEAAQFGADTTKAWFQLDARF